MGTIGLSTACQGGCSTTGEDRGWGLNGDYWFIYSLPGGIEMALGVLEYYLDDYLQYTLDESMSLLEK